MPTFRLFSTCIEPYENRPVIVIRPADSPIRNHEDPKKILVSCYMDREQLGRLKSLSDKTGAPMTHYLREGVALVLDKYAEKKVKGRKGKS
jgi:Ribbon-helix-helix domain